MKTIYKYYLKNIEQQTITMPVGSKILTIQIHNGIPSIWAQLDTSNELGDRTFVTFGTGYPLPDNPMEYIGTYQFNNGSLVFHVFELIF